MFSAIGLQLAAWQLGGWGEWYANFTAWKLDMTEERREVPNDVLKNIGMLTLFAGSVSIVGLVWLVPALIFGVKRWRGQLRDRSAGGPSLTPLAWLMLGAGTYLASLLVNHDTPVNPRFAMPLMFPMLILEGYVLAEVVARRDRRWFIALLACGLAGILIISLAVTVPLAANVMFMQIKGRPPLDTWALFALTAALLVVLARLVLEIKSPIRARLAGAAAPVLVGLFMLTGGLGILDFHFYRHSRYKKQFVAEMLAPGAMPADAMLIPSGESPDLQYVVNSGQHVGWVMPGVPYKGGVEGMLGKIGTPAGRGWLVISSGWNWPNGKDKAGRRDAGPQARAGRGG